MQQPNNWGRTREEIGYEAAKVETEKGAVVLEAVHNNNRVLYNDANLAVSIWERLKPFAPQKDWQ